MGTDLWHLPAQLAAAPNLQYDSMRFGRKIDSGLFGFASLTWFPGDHLGYTAELSWSGLNSSGQCAPLGPWVLDSQEKNAQACGGIDNGRFATSMTTLQAGLTLRVGPSSAIVPYVRATAGVGLLNRSFVQSGALISAAPCGSCILVLVDERGRPGFTWAATLAVGNTVSAGPGLGLKVELRDLIASLPVATDSGTPTYSQPYPYVKTGWRVRHMLGFSLGLEVALERSHQRRY